MELNKKMEIIEERTAKVSQGLNDIINKLSFIPQEMHELSNEQKDILIDAYRVLRILEDNLYFNNDDRKERF